MLTETTRLQVWGDPISHSRSPQLHSAAYRTLGLAGWSYDRRRVDEASFAAELGALDPGYRGLSLTMPLKESAFRTAVARDERAERTGAVNTLLLGASGPRGFNTDVGGIVAALREEGIGEVPGARILGAGATATSALVAAAELGARRVEVVARRPEAAERLVRLGRELDIEVEVTSFEHTPTRAVPVTIATLPGGAQVAPAHIATIAETGGLLLDVVYGTWPTAVSAPWQDAGGAAVSGLGMLLHQALLQVRVFVNGDISARLDREDAVLAAMRAALVGD